MSYDQILRFLEAVERIADYLERIEVNTRPKQ